MSKTLTVYSMERKTVSGVRFGVRKTTIQNVSRWRILVAVFTGVVKCSKNEIEER